MTNQQKPSFETLLNWLEGRLSTEEAQTVAERVNEADYELQAEVAWLQAFLETHGKFVLGKPSARVRGELTDRFTNYARQKAKDTTQAGSHFQRLIATLVADSGLQLTPVGLRNSSSTQSRQLLYSTNTAEVALNVLPSRSDNLLTLMGQILPIRAVAPDSFSVQLLHRSQEVGITMADELGEFKFTSIVPGEYRVVLTSDTLSILLMPIDLRNEVG